MAKKIGKSKRVETLTHDATRRRNIPTAEYQSVMHKDEQSPVQVAYERRNRDLDPQLVWRGKDEKDWSDLAVDAPPLYIQEKVHPKALIDDLRHQSKADSPATGTQTDLFSDFNGLPSDEARTEFYQHDANWSNRMILGDSLQVMASLAEREGLRGKVQCIYLDPPYGIKFNSNFQWSTTSRDVKDGKREHITREPEQVKAFRDTWRDGIHSYLTYLRDRLTVARDLLTESGSIFVQIGDENVHRVRALMDEVFGEENFVSQITVRTSSGTVQNRSVKRISDYLIWFAKSCSQSKFRRLLKARDIDTSSYNQVQESIGCRRPMTREEREDPSILNGECKVYRKLPVHSMAAGDHDPRECFGAEWRIPPTSHWRYSPLGFQNLLRSGRLVPDRTALTTVYFHDDFPVSEITNSWTDTGPEIAKTYVVQTALPVVQRCILMTTDPGDLVLDPTCGSGTTAYVAEQWGRRWITIDTSRVALALARARIMGARYPYYLLADSVEGRRKEAEITCSPPSEQPTSGNIRHGFVYKRVPHITLKSIANNAEIDVLYEQHQPAVDTALADLNTALESHATPFTVVTGGRKGEKIDFTASGAVTMPSGEAAPANGFMEWEVPREACHDWPEAAAEPLERFWQARIARQRAIDASIAAKAEFEYLYDKPYEDKQAVRVAGPFTVESLSPHRVLGVGEDDELLDRVAEARAGYNATQNFDQIILANLKTSGVQQAHKDDKIDFTHLEPWPGEFVCAEGRYPEGGETGREKRAAVFVGPEFGTVSRPDLVEAAREAADAGFDVLIACAFNYDAQSSELNKLGRIPILKARMNADLHMADDLKNTGKGNLFVIFGEPDMDILNEESNEIRVHIKGVDVFHPNTGEIRSDGPGGIACWFIDTDYNEESFFVRQAYFLGRNDPYKSLKTTLKAEINEDAWSTLNSDTSRPFPKPESGRIAVKVINHLGDEVMKVLRV